MNSTINLLLLISAFLGFYYYFRTGRTRSFKRGSILAQYTKDLTRMAQNGTLDPVIGRKQEIARVVRTLSRRTKNNVVLVGKAGVGKTAIAEGLAYAIVGKRVPQALFSKRVLALDLNALVAGTKYRGEFEERMIKVKNEIAASGRNIILFVDEVHALAQVGEASGAINAGDILKPALARGDLQMVGATTPMEYEKYVRQDPTLERRLQPILVSEPTLEQTLEILRGIKSRYEEHHGVEILDQALKAAIELSEQYLAGRSYPDKAIDLMDEAASKVKLGAIDGKSAVGGKPIVDVDDVKAVAEQSKASLDSL